MTSFFKMAAPMRTLLRTVKTRNSVIFRHFGTNNEGFMKVFKPNKYPYHVENVMLAKSPKHGSLVSQVRHMCQDARRGSEMPVTKQPLLIDTHAMVKALEETGLSTVQSERIVDALVLLSQAELDHVKSLMVTKPQHEILTQQMMAHLSSVKKDMVILEKSEFSALKHEYEKQHIEVRQIRQHFEDEITKLRSGVTLDLNLEKSRAKEAHADNLKGLDSLKNVVAIERSQAQRDVSMLDNKIDKEIANLLATYERYRNDVIKYAAGTVMTCLTLCLGFFRLWS